MPRWRGVPAEDQPLASPTVRSRRPSPRTPDLQPILDARTTALPPGADIVRALHGRGGTPNTAARRRASAAAGAPKAPTASSGETMQNVEQRTRRCLQPHCGGQLLVWYERAERGGWERLLACALCGREPNAPERADAPVRPAVGGAG